ncbi:MAG: hypothetical protein MI806_12300 [Minwuiales bacterium]|nr:hypothetical protein [Minwuiales bacterium]
MVFALAKAEENDAMPVRETVETKQEIGVLEAQPKKLSREQFKQLYKRVARKIPKSLAILAK